MSSEQLIKGEIEKNRAPKRTKIAYAVGTVVAAGLVVGGVFGVNAYRAEGDAKVSAAQEFYNAAAEQNELAQAAAAEAADSAQTAEDAATAAEAEEAAAAAAVAAQQAAEAVKAANVSRGLTPEGKCPAGTKAGEVHDDGTEGSCSPTNQQGQPCVAYNDANECIAWYKP